MGVTESWELPEFWELNDRGGRQFEQKRTRLSLQRQGSQHHFDYALQFVAACAAGSLDCHAEQDRRDVARKVSRVHIGREVTF